MIVQESIIKRGRDIRKTLSLGSLIIFKKNFYVLLEKMAFAHETDWEEEETPPEGIHTFTYTLEEAEGDEIENEFKEVIKFPEFVKKVGKEIEKGIIDEEIAEMVDVDSEWLISGPLWQGIKVIDKETIGWKYNFDESEILEDPS